MSEDSKTKFTGYKWPPWFVRVLNRAKEKEPERTEAQIIIMGTCKAEGEEIPESHKFRKPRK